MQGKLFLYIIGLLIIGISMLSSCSYKGTTQTKEEYSIDLIDEKTVCVYSHSTGITYFCSPEDIPLILDQDNL